MLGLPDIREISIVRIQKSSNCKLVLGQQRSMLVNIQCCSKSCMYLCKWQVMDEVKPYKSHHLFSPKRIKALSPKKRTWVALQGYRNILHFSNGFISVPDLIQHQRPSYSSIVCESKVLVISNHLESQRGNFQLRFIMTDFKIYKNNKLWRGIKRKLELAKAMNR